VENYSNGSAGAAYLGRNGVTIVNGCVFDSNSALQDGGGVWATNNIIFVNTLFFNNTATRNGGGMYGVQLTESFTNLNFTNNKARNGGGLYEYNSNAEYVGCSFVGNSAMLWGGGLSLHVSNSLLSNCTITNNRATNGGGLNTIMEMSMLSGIITKIRNTVIASNTASSMGGGIYCNHSTVDPVNSNDIRQNKQSAAEDVFCTTTCVTLDGACACGSYQCGIIPTTSPAESSSSPRHHSNGGKIAAGILVPLIVPPFEWCLGEEEDSAGEVVGTMPHW
jgi:predicted outer membrane repeat protein